MDMWKLGTAQNTDQAQPLPTGDGVSGLNGDGAPAQVAILGFPAAPVADDQAVATFPALDGFNPGDGDIDILHAVADSLDDDADRRHRHAFFHFDQIPDR